jgi:hypothetical protein
MAKLHSFKHPPRIKKQNKTQKHRTAKPPFPIDVVYTWYGEDFQASNRLSNNNELKYSLRSVFFYAPWINNIYILMNKAKRPSWINDTSRIIIVDHEETFPSKEYLPNTNSNAIETTIANIPGLSEHYIYFNDDMFLGRKTKYTDFFTPNGKAIVDMHTLKHKRTLKNTKDNRLNIQFPPHTGRFHIHIPTPRLKSIVIEFNQKYADYIDWIRRTKKRKAAGFDLCKKYHLHTPCQQTHYPINKYMYSKHKAVLRNYDYMYLFVKLIDLTTVVEESERFDYKLNEIAYRKPPFFSLSDQPQPLSNKKEIVKKLNVFFNNYYPKKADFEI